MYRLPIRKVIHLLLIVGLLNSISSCRKDQGCNAPKNLYTTFINGSSATFHWSDVSGPYAHGSVVSLTSSPYTVRYHPLGANGWVYGLISQDTVHITNLSFGTTYEWQIRTNCSGGSSDYSALDTFTTDSIGTWFFRGTTYKATQTSFYGATISADNTYSYANQDSSYFLNMNFSNNIAPGVYSVAGPNYTPPVPYVYVNLVFSYASGNTIDFNATGLDNAKVIVSMSSRGKLIATVPSLAVEGNTYLDTGVIYNVNIRQQ